MVLIFGPLPQGGKARGGGSSYRRRARLIDSNGSAGGTCARHGFNEISIDDNAMVSDSRAVLAANEAFYRAFRERDYRAMDTLWAHELPVVCIHPGWDALTDRAEVMHSWAQILANPNAPAIRSHHNRAFVFDDIAFVLCQEVIGERSLMATNIFARENGQWKLIHHHAGMVASDTAPGSEEPPQTVH